MNSVLFIKDYEFQWAEVDLDSKPLACNSYLTHKATRVISVDGCREYLNMLP